MDDPTRLTETDWETIGRAADALNDGTAAHIRLSSDLCDVRERHLHARGLCSLDDHQCLVEPRRSVPVR